MRFSGEKNFSAVVMPSAKPLVNLMVLRFPDNTIMARFLEYWEQFLLDILVKVTASRPTTTLKIWRKLAYPFGRKGMAKFP
jgi:hypothetical protein